MTKLAERKARQRDGEPGDLVGEVLPGEAATLRAAQEALDGRRTGLSENIDIGQCLDDPGGSSV